MRALLLAALSGQLPLGHWRVTAAVCLPQNKKRNLNIHNEYNNNNNNNINNAYRLAGTQAEGLEACTEFEGLQHAFVDYRYPVTLCKVKLIKGETTT